MNEKELKEALKHEITGASAKLALLVENLRTGETLYSYQEKVPVVSASMIKVPILITALELVKNKELTINTPIVMPASCILEDTKVFEFGERYYTLEELLVWMIINSDNSATNRLIDILTKERINETIGRLSLKDTKLERKMLDFDAVKSGKNNYTSAEDMLILYRAFYEKTILTEELCDYAIGILKRQRDKEAALRYIPDVVEAAHKTGGLDFLSHDAGIFYLPHADYYFGAFVWDAGSEEEAMRLIGRISRFVYEYYRTK